MTLPLILIVCLLGSLASVFAAAGYLLLPPHVQQRTIKGLVSFATGMLLGTAFLHLIPHAIEHRGEAGIESLMFALLGAICAFFLLEKGLIWRHHHCHGHTAHGRGADEHGHHGALILVGDSVHNFVDGVLISAAFVTDVRLGIVTAVAAIAHEIPQELGDFAILLNSGVSRTRAFTLNALTALTTLVGAALAYFAMRQTAFLLPYFLAFAAASFIYIAVADLMPTLNRRTGRGEAVSQMSLMATGIALTVILAGLQD